jgi:type II secretory pathway pseudopilin PulG
MNGNDQPEDTTTFHPSISELTHSSNAIDSSQSEGNNLKQVLNSLQLFLRQQQQQQLSQQQPLPISIPPLSLDSLFGSSSILSSDLDNNLKLVNYKTNTSPNAENYNTFKRSFDNMNNNSFDDNHNVNSDLNSKKRLRKSGKENESRPSKVEVMRAFFSVYFLEDPQLDQSCVLKDVIYNLYIRKIPKTYQVTKSALFREMWNIYRKKIKSFQSHYREFVKGLRLIKQPPHPDSNTPQYKESEQLLLKIGVADLWDYNEEEIMESPRFNDVSTSSVQESSNCSDLPFSAASPPNTFSVESTNENINNDNVNINSINDVNSSNLLFNKENSILPMVEPDPVTEVLCRLEQLEEQTRNVLSMIQDLKTKIVAGGIPINSSNISSSSSSNSP